MLIKQIEEQPESVKEMCCVCILLRQQRNEAIDLDISKGIFQTL